MKFRPLGKTGFHVSEIGYGGWGIGRTWWGTTDDRESLKALAAAYEEGINFFDTAYVYGDGHSERLMAKALRGKKVIVATKIPPKNNAWPPPKGAPVAEAFPADWIVSCTERGLKNLNRDSIDLTQFHVWNDEWLGQGWEETISELKSSGKIKSFGVSINDHDPNSALKLVASGLIDSVQVIFNIFDQSPINRLFPLCEKHGVGVIARVPFDEGGLTGTFTASTTFEKGDFRRQYFQGPNLVETVERTDKLKSFLDQSSRTLPELALKFVLAQKAVSTVIPGMRREKHVRLNAAVSEAPPLRTSILEELRKHAWPRNFYDWWDD